MRASGILMGISSIPSKYGIGCFSKEAYDFVDQLEKAGQQYWQILPLGPTGYGDSPYQSVSTFAGNPYFIDLEELIKKSVRPVTGAAVNLMLIMKKCIFPDINCSAKHMKRQI